MVETTVLAVPVVVVKPTRQMLCSLGRGCVGEDIGPFVQHCLDEALRLAIGLRRTRASVPMSDTQASTHRGELL